MTATMVFMDTETTGLSLDDDIWEFFAIRRYPDGVQDEMHLFIEHDYDKCSALPQSFQIDHVSRWKRREAVSKRTAASLIYQFMAPDPEYGKVHIVGAVPNFDTERLAILLDNEGGYAPRWHHHLIDVETLAVGYITARDGKPLEPPLRSDDISYMLGVDPEMFERHTARGDVLWVQAQYDKIMGRNA